MSLGLVGASGVRQTSASVGKKVVVLSSAALTMLFSKIRDKQTSSKDFAYFADRLTNILSEVSGGW
jgi:multidrug resistance efflux pump